jgi:hypothetical protein
MMWNPLNSWLRNTPPAQPDAGLPQAQGGASPQQAQSHLSGLPPLPEGTQPLGPRKSLAELLEEPDGEDTPRAQPKVHAPAVRMPRRHSAIVEQALRRPTSTAPEGAKAMSLRASLFQLQSPRFTSEVDSRTAKYLQSQGLVQITGARVSLTSAGRGTLMQLEREGMAARNPNPLSSRGTKLRDPALLELATFRSGQDPATLAHREELKGAGFITEVQGKPVLTAAGGAYLNSQQVAYRLAVIRSPKRM